MAVVANSRRRPPVYARQIGFYLLIALVVIIAVAPFLWLIINSFKIENNIYKREPDLLPIPFTVQNYLDVFQNYDFGINILNSFVASTLTTIGCLLIGTFAGYALGQVEFKGKRLILGIVLAVSMFPGIAIIAPLYLFFRDLNLINTLPSLLLPYITFNLPLTVWLLASFFRDLPGELSEAAEVDGSTPFGAFYRIMVPLAVPGIITAGILIFINAWNDFLFARTFLSTDSTYTAPVAIATFSGAGGEYSEPWGSISAGAVLVTVPLVILVLFFQRRIVSGLTSGALKG